MKNAIYKDIYFFLLSQVKKERKVEVEVQYTFVKKLRIPVGCDLERLSEIVKCVHVPDQVELWWVEMVIYNNKATTLVIANI